MNYFENKKRIDTLQILASTITTYILVKKYEDSTNFISMRLEDIFDNKNLEHVIAVGETMESVDRAVRDLDLLEDELNFISQQMTKEVLEDRELQLYCFNKVYDYEDINCFTEQIFKDLEYYPLDFDDLWGSFKRSVCSTHERLMEIEHWHDRYHEFDRTFDRY